MRKLGAVARRQLNMARPSALSIECDRKCEWPVTQTKRRSGNIWGQRLGSSKHVSRAGDTISRERSEAVLAEFYCETKGSFLMAYLVPWEFVTKMVDAGEAKVFISTRDTVIRAYMAGAILTLAAAFAVMVNVQTGYPIIGAILFPGGFCMLYLLGFDLLTGGFVLSP